ncbi:hypothetical protein OMAG_001550 [Candidatus Omnitrophus magneticus]|uniref:Uncharacterized protein n=1 Tax=Candidatus Omnitrophus magneticus TaxID=1609969 RepID=A0A0F0CMT4_9BACT|nr:hypothetical protein OMAG_001550 [Candidatus Omnitrophus magneticus]
MTIYIFPAGWKNQIYVLGRGKMDLKVIMSRSQRYIRQVQTK